MLVPQTFHRQQLPLRSRNLQEGMRIGPRWQANRLLGSCALTHLYLPSPPTYKITTHITCILGIEANILGILEVLVGAPPHTAKSFNQESVWRTAASMAGRSCASPEPQLHKGESSGDSYSGLNNCQYSFTAYCKFMI